MNFLDFFTKVDVVVYGACSMSGRDKPEMIARAQRVDAIFAEHGITFISPVLVENVKDEPGKLINKDKQKLYGFWARDKQILIEEAHVMFWDHAEMHSFGATREYCLNRGVLWKPTVIYVPEGTPTSVAEWEDDAIFFSVHHAAQEIVRLWGTRYDRWRWRLQLLNRTLPRFFYRQLLAWR